MQYAYIWDGLDAYNMMQLYGRTHACANGGGRLPASCAFARGVEKGGPACEPLQLVRTAQKGAYVGKYEVLSGEASRQRCLSSL